MKRQKWTAPVLGFALIATAALSGCGSEEGSGTPGVGGPGSVVSPIGGVGVVNTPYGSAVTYSFTGTVQQPSSLNRVRVGMFPRGNLAQGGNCVPPAYLQAPGFAYFCNVRDYYAAEETSILGTAFGTVTPGVTSVSQTVQRTIYGYSDGSSISIGTNIPSLTGYGYGGYSYSTPAVIVSGVITLSADFVRENLGGSTSITGVALDIAYNNGEIHGTGFVLLGVNSGTVFRF